MRSAAIPGTLVNAKARVRSEINVTQCRSTAAAVTESVPCRQHSADLWFADDPVQLTLAKSLCVPCPVLAECLAGALARREPWGVWGGELFDRGRVSRKRPRGRPRKTDRDLPTVAAARSSAAHRIKPPPDSGAAA
jgi:WhiB family redox-sensing transcriptional regulator